MIYEINSAAYADASQKSAVIQTPSHGAVVISAEDTPAEWAEFDVWAASNPVTEFVAPKAVPPDVSPRQARLALLQQGLLDKVQQAVTAAGGATQITWDYATIFERNDPLIVSIGQALGLTSDQIDQLFVLAATF